MTPQPIHRKRIVSDQDNYVPSASLFEFMEELLQAQQEQLPDRKPRRKPKIR
jgi:hypothetical protein